MVSSIQDSPATHQAESAERLLVQRLKAGDAQAFEEMVRTLGGRLLSVARRFLSNDEDARDALQDAFLSAFKGIKHFDEQAQLSTWLHRIVVNAALMRIRSRSRRPEHSIDALLPRFADDGHHVESYASPAERPDQVMEREEVRVMVRAAIAELPEQYRAVLLMRDIEEMSTRDTADALGISENAAKLRLHRARLALMTVVRRMQGAAVQAPRRTAAPRVRVPLPRPAAAAMFGDHFAGSSTTHAALAAQ